MGVALAALFFYPLASVLQGSRYYLQWQPSHSAEAIVAFLLVAGLGGVAFHGAARLTGRAGALALAAIALLPVASFATVVVAQAGLRGSLISLWERDAIRLTTSVGVAAVAAALFLLRPAAMRRAILGLLAVLSPIAIVVLLPVISAAAKPPTVVAVHRPVGAHDASSSCTPVLAFLFDELSFAYLYEGREIRPEFPAIRRLAARATHHLAVSAPGRETLIAMPALLAARPVASIEIQGQHHQLLALESRTRHRFKICAGAFIANYGLSCLALPAFGFEL